MNQMSNRRELTIDQRRAKNERDRRRRREHKMEVERLRNAEAELQALLATQRNENRFVTEENERLNGMMLNLKDTIHQLQEQKRELEEQNLRLQETMNLADSWFAFDIFRSPNEEVANNETIITHGPESSQSTIRYADELVEDFTKKLDAKEKSNLEFSDFDGLEEELRTSGINSLPPSLALVDSSIKETFGDISAGSTQSSCMAMPIRIVFCAAIREMCNLKLCQIDERKILLWRDAINSALNINFKVEFAVIHLKKIASAYFGLIARREKTNDSELKSIEERISKLIFEQHALEAKRARKVEEWNSETRKQCLLDAEYFEGKYLSTGLLH